MLFFLGMVLWESLPIEEIILQLLFESVNCTTTSNVQWNFIPNFGCRIMKTSFKNSKFCLGTLISNKFLNVLLDSRDLVKSRPFKAARAQIISYFVNHGNPVIFHRDSIKLETHSHLHFQPSFNLEVSISVQALLYRS